MPDYKELYIHLMRASETAIRTLVEAQQDCEERFLNESELESMYRASAGRSGAKTAGDTKESNTADRQN